MIVFFALVVAILFGAGAYLMLHRDLIRVVAGLILISNAVILFIVAAGLTRGLAPIYPLPEGQQISDPLVQAMALTAIVISFGITAFLLSLVYRVYTVHETVDRDDLSVVEGEDTRREERLQEREGERRVGQEVR